MKSRKPILLYNARIYPLDAEHSTASAILLNQGRVRALGESASLRREFEGVAEQQDLGGRTLIPGLTDAHIHLEHYALGLQKVDCETTTLAECLRRVGERARITPPGEWVLGHGWNHNEWPDVPSGQPDREPGYGSAADLEAVAPRNPVFLTAKSLHAAWASRTALQQAGVTALTPDPPGGRLGRDEHGQPNGILYESAVHLVAQALPEPGEGQVVAALRTAQPVLWQMGVTGVHDFDGRRCFVALQILHQAGELRLRVLKGVPLSSLPHATALGLRSGWGDDFLRIGGVKAFADGALGPQTAAMLQPYEGTSGDSRGLLLLDAEELYEHGCQAVQNGLHLAVHAIGDRANHEVLNAFERLRQYEQHLLETGGLPAGSPLRHRIEHVQLLHPEDTARLAQLGIIASMQPLHATSDMVMADRYWGERVQQAYAWRTQLHHGATLAFGSDAPVESPNPFWGLHAAVTRRRADGLPGPQGWVPAQKLSVFEGLRAYTVGPAFAAGWEDHQGCLLPGYFADLLVLDTDPFTCEPEQLRSIRPEACMVAGEWVWQR